MTRSQGSFRCVPDWPEMLLKAMPGTMGELAAKTGTPKGTMKAWCLLLRRCGWCYVSTWDRIGMGKQKPVLKAGPGWDRPCPPPLTSAEQAKLFRSRARYDGRYGVILKRVSARRKAEKIRASGRAATPWDALMGRA